MHPEIARNLALVLFFPWFSILAALFCAWPRQPRSVVRTTYDVGCVLLATAAAAAGMHASFGSADPRFGAIWPQVLATSVAYGLFLLVLTAAWWLRRTWLPPPRPRSSTTP